MQPVVFIARLIGPVFTAIGVGMLANRTSYIAIITSSLQSGALIYLSGVMALTAGLAIVNVHRIWTADWRVVVTVLGWLMVIGGVVRIVLPQFTVKVGGAIYSGSAAMFIVAAIVLLVGGFLSFKGYTAK